MDIVTKRICGVEGCGKPHKGKGYCNKHYTRLKRHGDAIASHVFDFDMPVETRFWGKVKKGENSECWEWQAALDDWGYGTFLFNGKSDKAHRVSFMLNLGEIPHGILVCHKCDNPKCVNPNHLFLGTHKDNAQDCASKGRSNKPFGKNHHKTKLSESSVIEIRDLKGTMTSTSVAKIYGVSHTNILSIWKGATWKHLEG